MRLPLALHNDSVSSRRTSWIEALWDQRWAVGLAAASAAGIAFRLMWLRDMEYKGDQIWTLDHVMAFWRDRDLPLVGMRSSTGVPNAGLSIWVFIAMGAALRPGDPLALTRAVGVTNVAAILVLAFFAARIVAPDEREPWLWSLAMTSVSPLSVLFSRTIWAQEILPLFTMGMLFAWWRRSKWWGAFVWGLIGALLGQIHFGGFFFATAFIATTLLFDRRAVHWRAWLLGSAVGALPILTWAVVMVQTRPTVSQTVLANPISYVAYWLSLATGLDLPYTLGRDFLPFLAFPRLGTTHTYAALLCFAIIAAILLFILDRVVMGLLVKPSQAIRSMFGLRSSTGLAVNAAFWGYGLFLLLAAHPFYIHYLVVTFSLPALSVALMAGAGSSDERTRLRARGLLSVLVLAQACTTILFLSYVHGASHIAGDYGTPYRAQLH
jgi:hypothetical protein